MLILPNTLCGHIFVLCVCLCGFAVVLPVDSESWLDPSNSTIPGFVASLMGYSCQFPDTFRNKFKSGKPDTEKVQYLGAILKKRVLSLRNTPHQKVDLVFLVDSSASVGETNFANELRFVTKLLADFTVDQNSTRIAIISYSSPSRLVRHVDHISRSDADLHKCSLLHEQLPNITYTGGGTYTRGAILEAKVVSIIVGP